jgi:hypothetical protein
LKDQFWFVRDVVEGEGRHLLETYWHLAPGLVWKEETIGSFLVEGGVDASRSLALFATDNHNSSGNVRRGWYSRAYGAKTEISVLEFRTLTDVPFEFATVLFPGRASAARLAALPSSDGEGHSAAVVGYRFEESGEIHFFLFATSREPWAWQGWSSDARFLYGRANGNNELVHLVLCDGSFAGTNGRRLFDSQKVVARYEWLGSADAPHVWCSDPEIERAARVSTSPVPNETISVPDPLRGST